jgi:hypothetical protein
LECGFDLGFTFEVELVPFHQFLDSYRYSHFATVYFYACCVCVRSDPSIEPHLSKACGLLCRESFLVVKITDAMAGSRRSYAFQISTAFGEFMVRLPEIL